jgi:hypothetical protein
MIIPTQYTPQTFAQQVQEIMENYQARAERAEKFAAKTREEIKTEARRWKEEAFEQLEERDKLVYGRFDFPQEMERWKQFCDKHKACCSTFKANGGKMPYIIPYGTGIGTIYTAVCQVCGEKENITYSEGW